MSHPATPQAAFKPFRTELGWCGVAWHGPRLLRVQIGHLTRRDVGQCWQADNWSTVTGSSVAAAQATNNAPGYVQDLIERMQRYAVGEPTGFDDVAVEYSRLTAFQARVLRACRRIGWGHRLTYGELAGKIGNPGAARAVGTALSRNPFPVIIPCHRVVAAGRDRWGGFSAPGGVDLKQRMLALEAA